MKNHAKLAEKYLLNIETDGNNTWKEICIIRNYVTSKECVSGDFGEFLTESTSNELCGWTFNADTKILYIIFAWKNEIDKLHSTEEWTFKIRDNHPLYINLFNPYIEQALIDKANDIFEIQEAMRKAEAVKNILHSLVNEPTYDCSLR